MLKPHRPYIGITGFTNEYQVKTVCNVLPTDSYRMLMVGVLVSSKTMRGEQNKWPNRYPKPEFLNQIFQPFPNTLNLVHFNTKEPEMLYDHLNRIREMVGPNCHGFQLNMAWPDPDTLAVFAIQARKTIFVLQVGNRVFEMIDNSPKKLAERVANYKDLIDYVLLDPSGGLGIPMITEEMKAYLGALKEKDLDIGLGVAGGLGPGKSHLIEPLVREHPDLSIDVEKNVRDQHDMLDLELSKKYITEHSELLNQNRAQ